MELTMERKLSVFSRVICNSFVNSSMNQAIALSAMTIMSFCGMICGFRWNLLQPEKNVLVSSCMPWLISSFASLRVQYPPKRLNSVSSAQALFAEFGRAQGESLIFR